MPSVAFLPLPEPGHILPTLRTASLLQQRGHEVFYFSLLEFKPFFRTCGFDCHSILETLFPKQGGEDLFSATFGDVTTDVISAHLEATGKNLLEALIPALSSRNFDLLLCDPFVTGGDNSSLQERLGRPVLAFNGFFIPEQSARHESEGPEIVLCPREFGIPSERGQELSKSDSIFYGEPSIFYERPRTKFPWHELRSDRQLIYCGLGSQIPRYAQALDVLGAVIEACATMQSHQLVVAAGQLTETLRSRDLPRNVILTRSAPQLDLLARVKLFITHGGFSGIKEAIVTGVPMLVVPFDLDQPTNALRVEHHRLGRSCLPEKCSSQTLRDLISEIPCDLGITRGLNKMREIFVDRERRAPAAKLILSLL
jgi:UDP:flavonoid glycosyltransferase YjiC (YdhE family)